MKKKVEGVDYHTTFDYLAFHTPFAGMVKGAHRKIMRSRYPNFTPNQIEDDFTKEYSLHYHIAHK